MTKTLKTEQTYRKLANGLGLQLSTKAGMYTLFEYKDGWGGGYQGWDVHPSCWGRLEYPLTLWDVAEVLKEEKQRSLDS